MSASSGPSILTDGLVFDYDMSNTQKSFKGAPTTNLLTNPNSAINVNSTDIPLGVSLTGYSSYSTGYNVADWAVTSTAATGVTFSFSIYMRSPGAVSTYLFYAYTGTGPDSGWFGIGSGALTNTWTRYTFTTGSLTGTLTTIRIYRLNSAGTIELAAPQAEVSSVASTFVVGTRSTSQALLDLTGRNTLTVNSLTYASNNTFSFSGSNYLTLPASVGAFGTGNFTINCWWKSSGTQSNYVAIMEQGFTGSPSNGAWAFKITHNTSIINFTYYNGGIVDNLSSFNINDSAWHNYLAVRSGTNLTLYVDGVSRYSLTLPTSYSFGEGSPVFVGYNPRDGTYINGSLPVLSTYNRALSATEIQQNFNAVRSRYGI